MKVFKHINLMLNKTLTSKGIQSAPLLASGFKVSNSNHQNKQIPINTNKSDPIYIFYAPATFYHRVLFF